MALRNTPGAFGAVAVALHWIIAVAILAMIYIGYRMVETEDYDLFALHKSLGLTILMLSLLRLVWRFIDPPPPLPASVPRWERIAARASHWAFYALMIGIPLTGWLYISASPTSDFISTRFWGLFETPLIQSLATHPDREAIAARIEDAHSLLAYGTLLLLALHVGAALKHHFIDRNSVLAAMLPLAPNPERKS